MAHIKELSDNRYIGCEIIEIQSFPKINMCGSNTAEALKNNTSVFIRAVDEVWNLGVNDSTVMELLWVPESVDKQTFRSKIRIFLILRQINKDANLIKTGLEIIKNTFITAISGINYNLKEWDSVEELEDLLGKVDDNSAFAVIKSEKCSGNTNSFFPYYYCSTIATDSKDNFEALVATLSKYSKCAVSFQLFPTRYTQQEIYCMNEVVGNLNRLSSGIMLNRRFYRDMATAEPLKVLSHYNERTQAPLFQYNILTFGKRSECAGIATKIISILKSGQIKISSSDFVCLDISMEHILLKKDYLFYPWNISSKLIYEYRNKTLLRNIQTALILKRLPYLVTSEEIGTFFRLPLYMDGMNALTSNEVLQMAEQFDETVVDDDNIKFGNVITNESQTVTIGCPANDFTKHALVVGVPGSGKTTFAFWLLLQFHRKEIPFLAIEPTKTEYRGLIDAIPDIQIFTPGNQVVSPFIINPFIPPKGITVEQYVPSLASAFNVAFEMTAPLDVIFLRAIHTCYIEYGWKDYSRQGDSDVIEFGLFEFILVFKRMVTESTYSRDVKGNLESGGVFRLLNLLEQNSNIYDTIHTIPIEDLLKKSTVIELNSIDNTEQKALMMALILINICVYTKHNQIGDGNIKNAILIDEAHVLLSGGQKQKNSGTDAHGSTVKALQDMIAEIRSYGTSIIIADQSPAKVSREIIAQTEVKIAFRLVEKEERELIADSTGMDEIMNRQLSKLRTGEAMVYFSRLTAPQMVMTKDIREEEDIRLSVTDSEVADRMEYWETRKKLLVPYAECKWCKSCNNKCDFFVRANSEYLVNKIYLSCRKLIKNNEIFMRYLVSMQELLSDFLSSYEGKQIAQIVDCVTVKFARKIQLETEMRIKRKDLRMILESRQ